MVNDLVNCSYVMKPPLKKKKKLRTMSLGVTSGFVNTSVWESGMFREGMEALYHPSPVTYSINIFHLAFPEL